MLKWIVAASGLVLPNVSMAQGYIRIPTCDTASPPSGTSNGYQDASGNICVSASVSASISGFTAVTTGTPISVTTGGVTGTLPAGTVVVASNVGATNGAYCKLGASATTADQLIPPNSWFAFTVGASTQLTCITASSTTTVNMTGGAGLPTGSGGGGGGSGGGGAVTIADAADATQGAIADAAATAGSAGTLSAKLRLATTQLATIGTNTAGASTAVNQTSQITQATASATALGAPADAACGTATGTCSIEALLKFLNSQTLLPIPPQAGVTVNIGNIGGVDASGATVTGQPVLAGGRAQNAAPTAVTNGQMVAAGYTLDGKAITSPYANPENFILGVITSAMTGTTSTSLVAAPAAGLRNYITACTFSNAHATVGTDIVIQDGSGGTAFWIIPAAAVYGGAHIVFPTPLRQPTTATAIYVANVTTGASTKAACSGYKGI